MTNFRSFYPVSATTRTSISPSPLLAEPSAATVGDAQRLFGHGFGEEHASRFKAHGEYLERFIAFRAIPYPYLCTFSEMILTWEARLAWTQAISETCSDPTLLPHLAQHRFRTVDVRHLITDASAQVPWALVSLHSDACLDFTYIPIRDTSGSGFHRTRSCAREAALFEFIERQSLTAMWAARRCLSHTLLTADQLCDPKTQQLATLLTQKGVLHLYDISFIPCVHTVFIAYKAKCADDYVQFSCGSSAAADWQTAVNKALIETWQTGLLLIQMPIFKEQDYGSDTLKEEFQKANYAGFDLGIEAIPHEEQKPSFTDGSLEEALWSLADVSPHLFIYEQPYSFGTDSGVFCKVLSPDFFIHMNPGAGNNNNNLWLKKIAQGRPLRLESMPFA